MSNNKFRWTVDEDNDICLKNNDIYLLVYRKSEEHWSIYSCDKMFSDFDLPEFDTNIIPQKVILKLNEFLHQECINKIHEYTQLKYQLPPKSEVKIP